jgi:carbon starvation protein CstA
MTLREQINRKEFWSSVCILIAAVLFVLVGVAAAISEQDTWFYCVFIPLAAAFGCGLYKMVGIRCGRCSQPIGGFVWFAIPSDYRFCESCGVDLDTEIKKA